MLNPGDSLLLETNLDRTGHTQSHLFVIILKPDTTTGFTILIPIDTIRGQKYDSQTILHNGIHPFIVNESFVNYRLARIETEKKIEDLITLGNVKIKEPFSEEVFITICEGILKSQFTPTEVREMYSEFLFGNL